MLSLVCRSAQRLKRYGPVELRTSTKVTACKTEEHYTYSLHAYRKHVRITCNVAAPLTCNAVAQLTCNADTQLTCNAATQDIVCFLLFCKTPHLLSKVTVLETEDQQTTWGRVGQSNQNMHIKLEKLGNRGIQK
jgi:hypothetical protein